MGNDANGIVAGVKLKFFHLEGGGLNHQRDYQYERLLHEAQRLNISLSEFIRRLADDYFAQRRPTADPSQHWRV